VLVSYTGLTPITVNHQLQHIIEMSFKVIKDSLLHKQLTVTELSRIAWNQCLRHDLLLYN